MKSGNDIRPLIAVTNDDGIHALGVRVLADAASRYADVVVVAPDAVQSGKSHSFTSRRELRVRCCGGFGSAKAYAVGGTPVDCVKLAVCELAPRRPDLLLAGINHGGNTSVSVYYSGTVGAAREAALNGIPSIALSLLDDAPDADMSYAARVAGTLIADFLAGRLPQASLFNVNIPQGAVRGLRMARMTLGWWSHKARRFRSPFDQDYYWLTSRWNDREPHAADTDESLVRDGYAVMTPLRLDITDYEAMDTDDNYSISL